jgi:hypothetical protein
MCNLCNRPLTCALSGGQFSAYMLLQCMCVGDERTELVLRTRAEEVSELRVPAFVGVSYLRTNVGNQTRDHVHQTFEHLQENVEGGRLGVAEWCRRGDTIPHGSFLPSDTI